MNKKGLRYAMLIGLIIGSLILILTVQIWGKYGKFLFKDTEDQVSEATFARVAYEMNLLIENNDDFANRRGMPISLDKDYALVGFNKEWDNEAITDGCHPYDAARKPAVCGDSACLCLYKNSKEDFDKMIMVECEKIDADMIVSKAYWSVSMNEKVGFDIAYKQFGDDVPMEVIKNQVGYPIDMKEFYPDELYSTFFLYSQCDGWGYDDNLGVKNYYIEKFVNGKTVIFIDYDSKLNDNRLG